MGGEANGYAVGRVCGHHVTPLVQTDDVGRCGVFAVEVHDLKVVHVLVVRVSASGRSAATTAGAACRRGARLPLSRAGGAGRHNGELVCAPEAQAGLNIPAFNRGIEPWKRHSVDQLVARFDSELNACDALGAVRHSLRSDGLQVGWQVRLAGRECRHAAAAAGSHINVKHFRLRGAVFSTQRIAACSGDKGGRHTAHLGTLNGHVSTRAGRKHHSRDGGVGCVLEHAIPRNQHHAACGGRQLKFCDAPPARVKKAEQSHFARRHAHGGLVLAVDYEKIVQAGGEGGGRLHCLNLLPVLARFVVIRHSLVIHQCERFGRALVSARKVDVVDLQQQRGLGVQRLYVCGQGVVRRGLHEEEPRHAAVGLQGCGAMMVGMVPVRAHEMVVRNVVHVGEVTPRSDVRVDVVLFGGHMQAVRVDIRGVRAVEVVGVVAAVSQLVGQRVLYLEPALAAWLHDQCGCRQGCLAVIEVGTRVECHLTINIPRVFPHFQLHRAVLA
mmetsp:Transcript_37865/g.95178  ORF Transcript_37865/g.95178 Transcript_37865/m.95178 type:complete len:497 (+) Transcript_37865:563-2053(+)